ncbi:hypothetical protein A1O3_03758 [Capronia epimyces CBS 606.96]|uniref:Uncharacterized protein n=1 Tax=Capronia epimyces CBS 606.96 TaxID=1182542 RepID=W9YWZ5_9EURO|nr:uncharacterized protein A1O3_03758 [Capronia epimyces CBS 606.96]EXJ86804.1 hypothetical protein A1O3_03758 [Capronia epimyces CBS 606.96]
MSGVEIGIAVIGAVAALITAYKDAGGIVRNIKERRKARGGLPPSVALQESLDEGYQEIEKITAKGVKRFGSGFEQGDDIAHRALQSLTIEVQASLLRHLTLASKDDTVTDFEACIDSAIEARLKAVTILNELYLRQQKRASLLAEPEVGGAATLIDEPRELNQTGRRESSSHNSNSRYNAEVFLEPSQELTSQPVGRPDQGRRIDFFNGEELLIQFHDPYSDTTHDHVDFPEIVG